MAKTWDEKLANLSVKLNDLSRKAAEASEDAKAYRELRQEVIEDKISAVKGSVAAMQENARLAEEKRQSRIRSEILKLRMTAQARAEDYKEARDRKRLEHFVTDGINYALDCYDAAALLIVDAELTILEVSEAMKEYEARFGSDAEPEVLPDSGTEA